MENSSVSQHPGELPLTPAARLAKRRSVEETVRGSWCQRGLRDVLSPGLLCPGRCHTQPGLGTGPRSLSFLFHIACEFGNLDFLIEPSRRLGAGCGLGLRRALFPRPPPTPKAWAWPRGKGPSHSKEHPGSGPGLG